MIIPFIMSIADTPLERVMKLYPSYMHHILSECVDNKWNEACRLLVEHEEALERNPPSSLVQRVLCRAAVSRRKGGVAAAEKDLEEKTHMYERLDQQHKRVSISSF